MQSPNLDREFREHSRLLTDHRAVLVTLIATAIIPLVLSPGKTADYTVPFVPAAYVLPMPM